MPDSRQLRNSVAQKCFGYAQLNFKLSPFSEIANVKGDHDSNSELLENSFLCLSMRDRRLKSLRFGNALVVNRFQKNHSKSTFDNSTSILPFLQFQNAHFPSFSILFPFTRNQLSQFLWPIHEKVGKRNAINSSLGTADKAQINRTRFFFSFSA